MFIMDYAKRLPEDQMVDHIANTIDRTDRGNIRTYKNTIVFVYADPGSIYVLEDQATNLAAIKKTRKDERIRADKSFMNQIASKESSAKCQLESDCMNVYCRVGYPYGVLTASGRNKIWGLKKEHNYRGSDGTVGKARAN